MVGRLLHNEHLSPLGKATFAAGLGTASASVRQAEVFLVRGNQSQAENKGNQSQAENNLTREAIYFISNDAAPAGK